METQSKCRKYEKPTHLPRSNVPLFDVGGLTSFRIKEIIHNANSLFKMQQKYRFYRFYRVFMQPEIVRNSVLSGILSLYPISNTTDFRFRFSEVVNKSSDPIYCTGSRYLVRSISLG